VRARALISRCSSAHWSLPLPPSARGCYSRRRARAGRPAYARRADVRPPRAGRGPCARAWAEHGVAGADGAQVCMAASARRPDPGRPARRAHGSPARTNMSGGREIDRHLTPCTARLNEARRRFSNFRFASPQVHHHLPGEFPIRPRATGRPDSEDQIARDDRACPCGGRGGRPPRGSVCTPAL
jgi:hypothetical protein